MADGVCVGVRTCVTILVLLCAVREALVMKAYPEFAVLDRYCEATIPPGGNTVCLWLGVRFIVGSAGLIWNLFADMASSCFVHRPT